MWVRLRSIQNIERQGRLRIYRPGDWVDVGKQQALLWMARGDADVPNYKPEVEYKGKAGVVIITPEEQPSNAHMLLLEQSKMNLAVTAAPKPCLAYNLNLIWDGAVMLRTELIGAGLGFLEKWEVACPLYSYKELAASFGDDKERERTKSIVRDLRIPVYDPRLLYVRECENTRRLFDQWDVECKDSADNRLSFLRAFYAIKPVMLALPITWTQPRAYADE